MDNSIKDIVDYNHETGIFTWKERGSTYFDSKFAGKEVGYKDKDGYLVTVIDGKGVRLHRLAWFICHGVVPDEIDHINRVKADNRISNLRNVTHSENMQNMGVRKDNKTGFKGVGFCSKAGKYRARCIVNGVRKTIGYSDTAIGANELIRKCK